METLAEVGGLRALFSKATTLTNGLSSGFSPVWLKDDITGELGKSLPPSLFWWVEAVEKQRNQKRKSIEGAGWTLDCELKMM